MQNGTLSSMPSQALWLTGHSGKGLTDSFQEQRVEPETQWPSRNEHCPPTRSRSSTPR
jgi:hypothetical protein